VISHPILDPGFIAGVTCRTCESARGRNRRDYNGMAAQWFSKFREKPLIHLVNRALSRATGAGGFQQRIGTAAGCEGNHRAPDARSGSCDQVVTLGKCVACRRQAIARRYRRCGVTTASSGRGPPLNKDRWRNMKHLAKFPRHLLADAAFPIQDLGRDSL